ncbi:uncharacterized protein LOC121918829 [Sceloporus undulatus]|uniref:uncharacterized protein LOC121918829 n=1 Tax=Sceloporus undulatus TaxID=8520 RepID=UPI001C4D29B9|nr:uncharacterized protein LOC121918829 [Sceloporus undulatus]
MLNFEEMTPVASLDITAAPPIKKRCVARRRDTLKKCEVIKQLFSKDFEAEESPQNSDGVETECDAEEESTLDDKASCSCYATEGPRYDGDPHEQVNQALDLGVEEQHIVAPKKRGGVMNKLMKVVFYAIIQHVKFESLKQKCPGCLYDEGNQEAHCCLMWDSKYINSVLKSLCSKLDMKKYLQYVITLAVALDSLSLNTKHLIMGSQIQNRVLSSNFPSDTIALLIKENDKIYLHFAEKLVYRVKYNYFLNSCDRCVKK